MALPTNFKRPAIPYVPVQVLANYDRYAALQGKPPTASQLDGDCNALMDYINQLAAAINETAAGIFPGADEPTNANKLPTTDGEGNVSWTQVTSTHLADQAVQTRHLSNSAVTREKLQVNAIGTNQLDNSAVTGAKIADESIESRHLAANAVGNEELANNAVTTAKMADQAVTTGKLGDLAVTPAKLAEASVTTPKLADAAVTAPKIAAAAIITDKLANQAVTNPKIAPKAIQVSHIDPQYASMGSVLMAGAFGNVSFSKITSPSFDASLIQQGVTLGSLNGTTVAPIGGLIFCMFQILSGSGTTLKWRGMNIKQATCVLNEETGEYYVTVTYTRQLPPTGGLMSLTNYNMYSSSYTPTGFTYITPGDNTASHNVLAYLPEGN